MYLSNLVAVIKSESDSKIIVSINNSFQGTLPEGDSVAMIEPQIGPLQVIAIAPGDPDLAAGGQSHQRGAGHMIGMAVRVEGGNQLEPELLDQCAVAQVLLVDRVDDHGLAALRVGQQVGYRSMTPHRTVAGRSGRRTWVPSFSHQSTGGQSS